MLLGEYCCVRPLSFVVMFYELHSLTRQQSFDVHFCHDVVNAASDPFKIDAFQEYEYLIFPVRSTGLGRRKFNLYPIH